VDVCDRVRVQGANVLDIVKAQTLVLSREAVDLLTKRLRPEQ
jgi:ribosomal protein L4